MNSNGVDCAKAFDRRVYRYVLADLLHLLFGSILAVDRDAALFVSGVASLTLLCIALCYRGLVSEAFDSAWLQVNHRRLPALLHGLFLALLVLNLVAGFQVLGTLMAVGVMMLPAVCSCCSRRRWSCMNDWKGDRKSVV